MADALKAAISGNGWSRKLC